MAQRQHTKSMQRSDRTESLEKFHLPSYWGVTRSDMWRERACTAAHGVARLVAAKVQPINWSSEEISEY